MKVFSHNGGRTEAAARPAPKLAMPEAGKPEGGFKDVMAKAAATAPAAAAAAAAAPMAAAEPALEGSTLALAASGATPK